MKELVGYCSKCGKQVYCLEGFLNGAHIENQLFCMECTQIVKNEPEDPAIQ